MHDSSPSLKQSVRTFSFRTGALLFVTLCSALMTFRIVIYYEAITAAYADTQAIIRAHEQEINEAVTRYGVSYVKILIREILKDPPDQKLYLAYRDKSGVTGSLNEWPLIEAIEEDEEVPWSEITVPRTSGQKPLHLLVMTKKLDRDTDMLIGYDLYRIENARHGLLQDILQNVAISLLLSGCLAIAIVLLINREFRKINRTCDDVIAGKIWRRVPVPASNDEFDRLGLNINKMLDWITTLLDTVRDSTNALAHDMRTPLSFHRLELQAVASDPAVPQDLRDKMRDAVDRIDTVVEMFDNILNISKAESRSGTELFASFDLAEAARDITDFYAPLFEEKEQTLSANIPENPLPFTGDEQLVKQAIVNLIDNAIKYTPREGMITVALRLSDDRRRAILTVSDDGPGIEEELREKAKERFFRLDRSRNTVGSGLGLSLVSAVAGLHQGALRLEDNAPGLRAILELPVKKGKKHEQAAPDLMLPGSEK